MSHFVVWVDAEDPFLIDEIMEPFCENTENPDYLEFQAKDEEYRQKYETVKTDCVRMPNGSLLTVYDFAFRRHYTVKDGTIYQKASGPLHHEKRTKKAKRMTFLPDYPIYAKQYDRKAVQLRNCIRILRAADLFPDGAGFHHVGR